MSTRAAIRAWFDRYMCADGSPNARIIEINRKPARADGDTATTDIPLADAEGNNARLGSIITKCMGHTTATGVIDDLTNEAEVTSAGNMQCSTTNTTGMDLDVEYIEPPI